MTDTKPKRNPYAANIWKYFLFIAIKNMGFGFIVATWVIFLQQARGFTLAQATIVDIAFWIGAALAEVPTGVVADRYGRKVSLACGTLVMGFSMIAWVNAPTMPLIMLTYAFLAAGTTFLTGAEDALFYESVQQAGRDDYAKLAARANARSLGVVAFGSVMSGVLASVNLSLPFIVSGTLMLISFFVVLTFTEPDAKRKNDEPRLTYSQILRQSVKILRARPTLRFAVFYGILVMFVIIVIDTVFVQPQALAWGVPLAAVGVVLMSIQFSNMVASSVSYRVVKTVGENRVFYAVPYIMAGALLLLGVLQALPALAFILVVGACNSIIRPHLMNRIQGELHDDIRATVLSMQSLMLTIFVAVGEPLLGTLADASGLPSVYIVMAMGLFVLMSLLFWVSRRHFPKVQLSLAGGD
jgi:predicted MFS family arabinose efflux permease